MEGHRTSSSGLSAEEQKQEKQRESVRKSREKAKQKEEELKAMKDDLEKELDQLIGAVGNAKARNAAVSQMARTMIQANPGAADDPRMQAVLNCTTDPAWTTELPTKSWKQH